jgi:hypothetical protein
MTTGPDVGEATAEAIALLMSPPVSTREQVLNQSVLAHRVLGSPAFPLAEDQLRDERLGRSTVATTLTASRDSCTPA